MDATKLIKVSADAHVNEPHNLWFERLDREFRDRSPRQLEQDEHGAWHMVVHGGNEGWSNVSAAESESLEKEREENASLDARFAMMRADGVVGEIIYPTIGLYVYNLTDPEVGSASCRVYNDWIDERLGGSPRVRLAGMIPTWDVDEAIREVHKVAANPSFGGLLLPLVGTPEWNLPQWEPLWSAVAETGLPIVMHQGTGHDMIFYRGWGSPTANLLATQSMAPRATALLSCSGVLERHPDLHVVLVEVNAGWMAWTMSTLDEYYLAHSNWSKPKLAELPSFYIRRQMHATFQADRIAIDNRATTGVDCLLWGNDFPHPEGTAPFSNEILGDLLEGVSDHDVDQIVHGNAARLFGFDTFALAATPV